MTSLPPLTRSSADWRFGQMDVGLVDQNDRVLGFVGGKILDVRVRSERAGGIVGIAHVEDPGVGSGRQHGFDVMRVGLGERNLDHARARNGGHPHARLETGIGGDVTFLRRSEGQHAETQRRSRAGGAVNPVGIQAFLLRESGDQFVGEIVGVAPALRDDGGDGVARRLAGAQRILVGIDQHRVLGMRRPAAGRRGQHGLGHHLKGSRGGSGSRQVEK